MDIIFSRNSFNSNIILALDLSEKLHCFIDISNLSFSSSTSPVIIIETKDVIQDDDSEVWKRYQARVPQAAIPRTLFTGTDDQRLCEAEITP